jgi:outer membrane protein
MRTASIILSSLAFIGVIILFVMQSKGEKPQSATPGSSNAATVIPDAPGRIAYVDIDTLEANYEYLKNKRAELQKRQENLQAQLERAAEQFQRQKAAFVQKVQAGQVSQTEGEATQKRLIQEEQSLQTRQQAQMEQLIKERDAFNQDLQNRLDNFLEEYNKEKKFAYVLTYAKGGMILYADKAYDITKDVINGMNEMSRKIKDTAKAK